MFYGSLVNGSGLKSDQKKKKKTCLFLVLIHIDWFNTMSEFSKLVFLILSISVMAYVTDIS